MRSAVLFVIFKRPDTTKRVFECIREAKPPRLYIAADGPREDRPEEIEKCKETREVVKNVDWPCEIHQLYRDKNLGCGNGVSSAINWFFEHEEEGIIIEDDILPHPDFFRYCDEMLEKYRDESRIKCVCGSNVFYEDIDYPYSYYFSHFMMVWGWATWKRTWLEYDKSLKTIPRDEFLKEVNALPILKGSKRMAISIYDKMTSDEPIDTWDYQLVFSIWHHNGLNIIPINNLCLNIGIGHADAVHTMGHDDQIEHHSVKTCYPLSHPGKITETKKLEKITFMGMYMPSPNMHERIRTFLYRCYLKLPDSVKNVLLLLQHQLIHIKENAKSDELLKYAIIGDSINRGINLRIDVPRRNTCLVIGDNCIVSGTFIFESTEGSITIGNHSFIGGSTFISRSSIIIGDNVTIAWGGCIYDHDSHSLDFMDRRKDIDDQLNDIRNGRSAVYNKDWSNVNSKPIVIKDDAWIGMNVIILKGVTIGRGAIVGAGSVVAKDVPDWCVAVGNPARVVKKLVSGNDEGKSE